MEESGAFESVKLVSSEDGVITPSQISKLSIDMFQVTPEPPSFIPWTTAYCKFWIPDDMVWFVTESNKVEYEESE